MTPRSLSADRDARCRRARLSLEGLSVGDAFGEGFFEPPGSLLTRIEQRILRPPVWRYTDDTEMALGILAVLEAEGTIDQDRLAQVFVQRYARNPGRGYGAMATFLLEAMGRGAAWRAASCAAFDGQGSMGNGAAMRVAPLGAYFADDLERVVAEARRSSEVTHTHPEGIAGAIAVAVAAAFACRKTQADARARARELFLQVLERTPESETRKGIARAADLPPELSVAEAVRVLGNGSRVTAPDTVPFCLWSAARNLDLYEEALWSTVGGLGDRDTTCAIVGGIVALSAGDESLPTEWRRSREPLALGL